MKRTIGLIAALATAMATAGCHPGLLHGGTPTGAVAATVDGHEITVRELEAEMGSVKAPNAKAYKAAEEATLERMVERTILADAARKQGLENSPDFAMAKQRAIDSLLVETLALNVQKSVPAPTREEAQAYVTEHSDDFANRKIFMVDQIRALWDGNPAVLQQLKPLNSLPAIAQVLDADHIAYQRGSGQIDSVSINPKALAQISSLPAGEVFIIPQGRTLAINQIQSTVSQPLSGEAATDAAMKLLTVQHRQQAEARDLQQILAKARPNVHFNKDFQPPKAQPSSTKGGATTNSAPVSVPANVAPSKPAS
ncbi:MAG: hypothetical protein ACRED8_06150 [Caulobacteraceae bacterium]